MGERQKGGREGGRFAYHQSRERECNEERESVCLLTVCECYEWC